MDKFFWFSLPITLMICYLIYRAAINKPVSRRDINMIAAIYLLFYLLITASLGLFWVARMDLPAFDLHYLFGYCLLFLVGIHLWFQLPLISIWLKKNSPTILVDDTRSQWKPIVKRSFLVIISIILFSIATTIVYEFIRPATVLIIENKPVVISVKRIWLLYKGKQIPASNYIHELGNLTRSGAFFPRFNINKAPLFKTYEHYPIINLPAPASLSGTSLTEALSQNSLKSSAGLSLQALSNLLYYSSGVTDTLNYPGYQLQLRAAASAGALYPNDLYVAAIAVNGLQPGIYYYHPGHHNLIKIHDQQFLEKIAGASPYADILQGASAVIMITAYFDRTVWKYHERSYRYILPDAGHILSNLTATTAAMKIPYNVTSFFDDDQMEKVMDLSQQNEGVLSIVVLGKDKLTSLAQTPRFTSVNFPKNVDDIEATRLSHILTSVKWVASPMSTPVTSMETKNDSAPFKDNLIQLPDGSVTESDVFTLIKNRRSFRQFTQREVSFNDLAGILHHAYSPLKNPHIVAHGKRVELYIIVTKIQNLAKGIYRYIPEKSALEKIADGDFSDEIYKAGLSQEVLKRAALVIAWVIDFNKIGELHGERDYRYASIESGIGSETAYLTAQARGLGACAVGAFYDEEVRDLLKINKTAKHAMLLTAIGQKSG